GGLPQCRSNLSACQASLSTCTSTNTLEQQRAALVEQLYEYLPRAESILSGSTVADSLFASAVRGRVTPLGEGAGLTRVKQYFFGVVRLFLRDVSLEVTIDMRSLAAAGEQVWVDVNITVSDQARATPRELQVHQVGFFRFNAANQIISFDLTMPNLEFA